MAKLPTIIIGLEEVRDASRATVVAFAARILLPPHKRKVAGAGRGGRCRNLLSCLGPRFDLVRCLCVKSPCFIYSVSCIVSPGMSSSTAVGHVRLCIVSHGVFKFANRLVAPIACIQAHCNSPRHASDPSRFPGLAKGNDECSGVVKESCDFPTVCSCPINTT